MPTSTTAAAVIITHFGTPSASEMQHPAEFFFLQHPDSVAITGQPLLEFSDLQHLPAILGTKKITSPTFDANRYITYSIILILS